MNALKAAVITMGVLIVIGATVVVVTIINRLGAPAENMVQQTAAAPAAAPRAFGSRDLDLPAGALIVETVADSGRLFLRVRLADGKERVLVVDPGTGATLGTLRVP